jgi:hypothetical protein
VQFKFYLNVVPGFPASQFTVTSVVFNCYSVFSSQKGMRIECLCLALSSPVTSPEIASFRSQSTRVFGTTDKSMEVFDVNVS